MIFNHPSYTLSLMTCWPTPLLGPKDHCSYGRLSVISGFSALSVSESDQETLLTNQVAARFCFSKWIYLIFYPSWKLQLYKFRWIWGFWIAWFRYQKLKIFPFEYLTWKQRFLPRQGFCPSFALKTLLLLRCRGRTN